jgi:hypothetical protein
LTDSSQSDKSIVIQKYLQGKSMNQIALETGISKGKVHYIINDWKKKIAIPDIDGIIDFIVLVRKSNMSIQQCAQGFRMTKMLRDLGIQDDNAVYVYDDNDSNIDIKNNQYNELSTFIQDIYLNCKNLGVTPANIFSWIKDLLDFNPDTNATVVNNQSSSLIDIDDDDDDVFYKKPILPDSLQAENKTSFETESNLDNNYNSHIKLKDDSQGQNKIPFTSEISHYLSQKKKEYKKLENYKKDLEKDIKIEESKRKQIEFELELLKQEQKYVMTFIDWFYDLKRKLLENYAIKIEDDIQGFSQLINDFKEHGYDAAEIIKEYLRSLSIKLEIRTHESHITKLSEQRASLNNSVLYLQSKIDDHKQTLDVYSQLKAMEFRLKELKQLRYTILEIADANNISRTEASSKFLKDVEEQYDTKLGFESKIKEKREELVVLNNQINSSRQILWFTPLIGPSLSNLFQKGIGEQDILGINQLVETCSNNINTGTLNENTKNKISRSEHWKIFTDDLKKYSDIKIAIKERQDNLEKVQKEVNELNKQKQDFSDYLQILISFINAMNSKISYYKGFMDHHHKDINDKINLLSRSLNPPIIIIYTNSGKDKEDNDDDDESI